MNYYYKNNKCDKEENDDYLIMKEISFAASHFDDLEKEKLK